MKFTVLGGSGFVGSFLSNYLISKGHDVFCPTRQELQILDGPLHHVIYCIGLTGNFRELPHETVDVNVSILNDFLHKYEYDSFLYLSSTRLYGTSSKEIARESSAVSVIPSRDSIYDLSKLLGEAMCLSAKQPNVRVARLSNVYGTTQSENTFLGSVLKSVKETKSVTFNENIASEKDYVSIDDVVQALEFISLYGKSSIYNVASGTNISHGAIGKTLESLGYSTQYQRDSAIRAFPPIDISRLKAEYQFSPRSLLDDLPSLTL